MKKCISNCEAVVSCENLEDLGTDMNKVVDILDGGGEKLWD